MKSKVISLIILSSAIAAATFSACGDGQTGGQNLNDQQPDTRILQQDGERKEECPDGRCPDITQPDEKIPDGKIPLPPPMDRRKPKRIFGDRDGRGERRPPDDGQRGAEHPEI